MSSRSAVARRTFCSRPRRPLPPRAPRVAGCSKTGSSSASPPPLSAAAAVSPPRRSPSPTSTATCGATPAPRLTSSPRATPWKQPRLLPPRTPPSAASSNPPSKPRVELAPEFDSLASSTRSPILALIFEKPPGRVRLVHESDSFSLGSPGHRQNCLVGVVGRATAASHRVAPLAAVHNDCRTAFPRLNRDRRHQPAALRCPIAWPFIINMLRGQAPRTVVGVAAARDGRAAFLADKIFNNATKYHTPTLPRLAEKRKTGALAGERPGVGGPDTYFLAVLKAASRPTIGSCTGGGTCTPSWKSRCSRRSACLPRGPTGWP